MNLSTVAIQEARSYEESQAGDETMKKSAGALSVDDISSDVIIQQKLQWNESVESFYQQLIQQEDFALIFQQSQLQWIQSQRKDFQTQCLSIQMQEDKSIVVEEDSGEAIVKPDASNSSIQSKSLYESAVANQPVASFASSRHGFPDARIEEVAKRSSRSDGSAAVDNLRRIIKAGCQLLSLIQMAKTTRKEAKKRTQVLFPVVAIQEARSYKESQAGAGTMKKSAGALSVDDISSDVIIQQKLQWNESAESFYQQLVFGVGDCKTMSRE
ncbi:hypothetical protein F511_09146 [Dorcoceras hygrometricum]|uniref:Uncharacterized protein n=1 Tax=Dorcoceras hygrometricum TaxID=472368 RepID=A0A2Z7AP10_9LAMI|nr:hypothetical protein F511_09146 [Dorcoceras hygrometricum]